MPKNNVTDLITDQEIAFARLVLAGTMTDRQAAEAAGLNPDTAAYTKAKLRVRSWMLDHRAALQQQLVQQEADEQRRRAQSRERVLDRLWEIAGLAPESTRNSVTAQVKALSMIIAIEELLPGRAPAQNKPAAPPIAPPAPDSDLPSPTSAVEPAEQPQAAAPAPQPGSFGPDARTPFSIRKPFSPPRLGHRRR